MEPPKNSSLDALYEPFRKKLENWLKQARATFPQFNIKVGETRRTKARQIWLYASGRHRAGPILTYLNGITQPSMHQYGLAADLVITRKLTPWKAEWDYRVWNTVFEKVKPEAFGLERLPFEMVHLQDKDSAALVRNPSLFGLTRT